MLNWNGTWQDKKRFHREGQATLRRLAKALGLATNERKIRSNEGGPAVSGEVILHTATLYLWIQASHDGSGVVIGRRCHGFDDCGAGLDCPNRSFPWSALDDIPALARDVRSRVFG